MDWWCYICVMCMAYVCTCPVLPACLAAARFVYRAASMACTGFTQVSSLLQLLQLALVSFV